MTLELELCIRLVSAGIITLLVLKRSYPAGVMELFHALPDVELTSMD